MPEIKKIVLRSGKVRYRTVVDVGRDAQGNRKQLTITRDKKSEVENEVSRIRHQRSTGQFIMPSKITVSEWIDQWLRKKARDLEETTLHSYGLMVVHIHQGLGGVRLQELTEEDVEEWVEWLLTAARRRGGKAGTGLRPSTAEGILGRLKEAMRAAVARKLVHTSVAQEVKIPRQAKKQDRRDNEKVKPWNVEEVRAFISGIKGDRLYAMLLLSLMGLRPAEVAGMRWEDVDLTAGTVAVLNTRTMLGNLVVHEKDTKTTSGERTLPLPQEVWDALKRLKRRQARERLAAGEGYTDSPYVYVDELGVPCTTRDLREHAYKLMASVGLRRVRLYDARHSCLTYLANNGVPDHILAAWAGHTNAAFTKAKYVHPDAEDLRPAAVVLDGLHRFPQAQV
ncbi:site-specific integrase [Streptomyces spinosisporus]|uniref:Site-specific integrase n=1 Tax=Streptomyces spinosisporus TaxID=2927582 RepID=A0ABS9XF36_9ACTN|nr:tyrosine-type recombinase/integrase [Streptomyces spinosisporus]MCI3240232.1 site-specific integrase [Streptomyces spinosisporus]